MLRYVFACGRGAVRLLKALRREDGYAIVLTLIALPFILGLSLLVIDASRVTNLHTDLQNAVDSMALAGARELDGRNDAIPRAKAAVAAISNTNPAWFGGGGAGLSFGSKLNVIYDPADGLASTVDVMFLNGVPASDDQPIPEGMIIDEDDEDASNDAAYVWVVAKPVALQTMFPVPVSGRDTVTVGGGNDFNSPSRPQAVATYTAAACDVTPIFICNPFEPVGKSFNDAFSDGSLYGREIEFRFSSGSTIAPGNFGFLRTYGNGANVLGEAIGKGASGICFEKTTLETEPGKNAGQVINGINTRMGIYGGPFGNEDDNPDYAPDVNVRKGQESKKTGSGAGTKYTFDCSKAEPVTNTTTIDAMAFPPGSGSPVTLPGGVMTSNNWDINKYWHISHGNLTTAPSAVGYVAPAAPSAVTGNTPSLPATAAPGTYTPSRYDVYNYEIANDLVDDAAPNRESGLANKVVGNSPSVCYKSPSVPKAGRRELFAAVVNCAENAAIMGGNSEFPAETYARVFITRPATDAADKAIYLETVDVTGKGGRGTVEDYLREEAELVR